jgi:hypothetical protein
LNRPDPFAWIPKLLAIFALGPLLLGFGWLLKFTVEQSLERQEKWVPGSVKGLEDLGDGTWRVAVEFNGKQAEAKVSRREALSSVQLGEVLEVAVNPGNPAQFQRTGAVENWAVPVMVGFFFLVILGLFIFMLRTKTPAMPTMEEIERSMEEQALLQETAPLPNEVLLKNPQNAYKLSGIAGTLLFMAAALITPQIPEELNLNVAASILLLAGSLRFLGRSVTLMTLELHFKDDVLTVRSLGRRHAIPLHELSGLEEVLKAGRPERETDYWCWDQQGKIRLKIDHTLEPEDQLKQLLRILRKRLPVIKR